MDQPPGYYEAVEEEFPGEYVPNYVCLKKEAPEEVLEEECESISSCPEARTTTGNILDRMITDPTCRRPPCLGKWPVFPPKSESDLEENIHQHRAAQQPTAISQMCSLRVTSDPNPFKQPAIVGTIGPASSDVNSIGELLMAGVNIIRVSMSHTDPCFKSERFQNIIEASNQFKTIKDAEIPIGVMMALKGPEIRTGNIDPVMYFFVNSTLLNLTNRYEGEEKLFLEFMSFFQLIIPVRRPDNKSRIKSKSKELYLKKGSTVRLTSDDLFENRCTDKMIYIDYECLEKQVQEDMTIYISDGDIKLRVDKTEPTNVVCVVETAGYLRNNQKVHIPCLVQVLPPLSSSDKECLEFAVNMDVDIIAVPITRNEDVIKDVKKLLREFQEDNNIKVLATISCYEGLENIDSILRVSDGIIIQKNDLSVDIGPEKVFIAQKEIIAKCNRVGKPVLCTASLKSVESSNKTSQRIEMNDIGGAIVDGADGIILISETAVGDQGVETVTQLSNIIREAEAATMQKPFYFDLADEQEPSIEPSKAIAMAAVQIANKIQASAILTVTTSGKTAEMLSWFRPRQPIIAITRVGKVARQMNLWRAVIPLHYIAPLQSDWFHDVKHRFEYGISYGKECGIIQSGDLLVLVSGFRKKSGFTNSIRIVFASLQKDGYVDNVNEYYRCSKEI